MSNSHQIKFKQTELGEIPEDWSVEKLGNQANIIMGQSPESKYYNESREGLYFMQGVRTFGEKFPSFDTWTTKATKTAPAGSVLMSVRAPVGDLNVTPAGMCIGRGLAAINAKNGNNEFIYQLLKAYSKKIIGQETGTVYGSISRDDLNNIELPFPGDEEQQKIAEVLGALDEKIELNRKMNKTLESLAQAIFKKWFIDDADPNWETKKLGNVVRIRYGKNLPTTKLQVSGHPVFGGNGQIGFFDKYIYESPQVLVACRGAASGKVNFSLPKSFVTNNSLVLEYDNCLNYEFLKYFALNADFHSCVSGSAQPQITIESLDGYEIIMPDKGIINKFGQVVAPITQKILLNNNEISNLSQIRDSLLPRLMSGKLRVS